jgi:hypothetical protein
MTPQEAAGDSIARPFIRRSDYEQECDRQWTQMHAFVRSVLGPRDAAASRHLGAVMLAAGWAERVSSVMHANNATVCQAVFHIVEPFKRETRQR